MTPREAKVWLIEQILIEANHENIVLDDLERRMLEFSEVNKTPPDFAELNAAFEVDHNDVEYEDKISDLARNRMEGLRAAHSPDVELWQEAVAILSEDDHYLLVMINMSQRQRRIGYGRPPHDRLKLVITAAAITIFIFVAIVLLQTLTLNKSH